MQVNIIKSYREVIAICDTELIGKKFQQENPSDKEHNLLLDVKESFYKGEEKTKEETITIMQFHSKEDATFNIAGKESIQTAIEAGIISEKAVGKIQGIPYALILC